jgi:hypothetical protein
MGQLVSCVEHEVLKKPLLTPMKSENVEPQEKERALTYQELMAARQTLLDGPQPVIAPEELQEAFVVFLDWYSTVTRSLAKSYVNSSTFSFKLAHDPELGSTKASHLHIVLFEDEIRPYLKSMGWDMDNVESTFQSRTSGGCKSIYYFKY